MSSEELKRIDERTYSNLKWFSIIILICAAIAGFIYLYDTGDILPLVYVFMGSLVPVILVWVDFIVAAYFYKVAEYKGYHDVIYCRLSFYLTFIGYLLVVALPDRAVASVGTENNTTVEDELPEI